MLHIPNTDTIEIFAEKWVQCIIIALFITFIYNIRTRTQNTEEKE